MAVPIYEVSPTTITTAETETDWSGTGQNSNKWSQEEDFVYEGTYSNGLAPSQTGDGVFGYDNVGGVDLSNALILMWVYVAESSFLSDVGNKAIYVRICSSGTWTTDYEDHIIGTSTTAWIGSGWHIVAVDVSRTADATDGTFVDTSIDQIGLGLNVAKIARKSTIFAIDKIMYIDKTTGASLSSPTSGSLALTYAATGDTITRGTGSWITDGFEDGDMISVDGTTNNDGKYTVNGTPTATVLTVNEALTDETVTSEVVAYITLADIVKDDILTDTAYGSVTLNRDNQYEINYLLKIGDNSGANPAFFISTSEVILLADQPNDVSIGIVEDTGETRFEMGLSDGTGDSRVGFAGPFITRDNEYFGDTHSITLTSGITRLWIFGTTFNEMDGGVTFGANTGHLITSTSFVACSQINLGSTESRGLIFTGYIIAAAGALLWSSTINIKNSNFLGNTNGSDASSIEHPAQGTFTYDGLIFSGNDYDIAYTAAASSGILTINAVNGANPATYEITNTTGNSVVINNAVTLTIICKNSSGLAVPGVRVRIETTAGVLITDGSTNSSGIFTDTYNYSVDVDTIVKARLKGYKFNKAASTITSAGLSIPFTMSRDPAVNLP